MLLRGGFGGPLHGVLDFRRKLTNAADVFHPHVVVVHALDVAHQVVAEQLHEEVDLGLGPAEIVLERKGVEGDEGQVNAGGCLDDELYAFGALLVAEEALQGALACPAAISIHDDGDVLGDFVGVELPVDALLLGGEFAYTAGG